MGVAAGAVGTIEGVAEGLSSAAKLYGEPYLQGQDNVALPESERSCSSGGHDMTIASLTTGFHFSRSRQISGGLGATRARLFGGQLGLNGFAAAQKLFSATTGD
jgi:hypothetical protein